MTEPAAEFQRMAVAFPVRQETVFCNWCGLPAETATFRVTSKQCQKVKCSRCHATFSKMSRANGRWPTPEFLSLSDETQLDFYAEASKLSKSKDVVKLMDIKLEMFKTKAFTWALGGAFLPLNVWQTKGFDSGRIERTTKDEDIQENEQVGTCYRVRLFSSLETGSEGYKQSQTLTSRSGDIPSATTTMQLAIQPPATPLAIKAEPAADFAARIKLDRDNHKTIEMQWKKKECAAAALEKKLAGPLERLITTMASKDAEGTIPELVKKGAIALRDQANNIKIELQAIIENPGSSSDPEAKLEVRA